MNDQCPKLLFSCGLFRLDVPGANVCVVQNLFPLDVHDRADYLLGVGQIGETLRVPAGVHFINYERALRLRSCPARLLGKLFKRSSLSHGPSSWIFVQTREYIRALSDRLAAQEAKKILVHDPSLAILMGYGSLSLELGRLAKREGRRYAIHCPWCHPDVQNALVAAGYRTLGLPPPPVSRTRVRRQLAELELADIIWCPSKFVQQSLIDNGVPKEKTFVAHLGVDVERFRVPEDVRKADDPFQILFVGNVCVQKGVHVLLEALAQADLPDATMVFNGQADATAQALIKKYEPKLAKKNITICVDPGDPRRNPVKASVFVWPSLHDAYGIVVPEAMAAGLPIIISDHAGAHEIVEHGQNGFVFPSGNSRKLAEHLEFLYQYPEAREACGRTAGNMSGEYDVKRTAERVLAALIQNYIQK